MMALRCGGCVASTSELPALVEVPGATVAGFLGGALPTPRKRLGVNSWDSESEDIVDVYSVHQDQVCFCCCNPSKIFHIFGQL